MARTDPGTLRATPEDGSDYTDVEIPQALGERSASLMGLDDVPETVGDIVDDHNDTEAFVADGATWKDMLVTEESRHEVRVGEDRYNTYCVLDALILPFVHDEEVEIRSTPPGGGSTVEIRAGPDALEAEPASTVVSFGFSDDVPGAPAALPTDDPEGLTDLIHAEGCPQINAFPDADAYEAWAGEAEAATVAMTLAQAYAMARDAVTALPD